MHDIDEILARLDLARRTAGFKSERAWCREAGVSEMYISAIRGRGGAKGTGQVKDVKRETMAKLAKTAGIELGWLLGEGDRDPVRLISSTLPAKSKPERSHFDEAFDAFEWPDGITAAQADDVRRRAMSEVSDSTRTLPVGFWSKRLRDIAAEVMTERSRIQKRKSG